MAKKFRFSMEKLKAYREQVLEVEKNQLSSLRNQQLAAEEEKLHVEDELAARNAWFVEKMTTGMTNMEITFAKNYLNALMNQRRILTDTIRLFQEKIEKQIAVVVDATREVSILDKLREKQWGEYREAERKAEELFIDEYVSYQKSVASANK